MLILTLQTMYHKQIAGRLGFHYEALNASDLLVDGQNRTLRTISSPDDQGLKVLVG